MKRTTLALPDDLANALEREARSRRTSVSAVAREALSEHLGLSDDKRQLPFAALGRSGRPHTARNLEEELGAEWERHAGDR